MFYGQFDPPVDRFIYERYFPDPDIKGVFVECGAFDGTADSSCRFFEETAGWTGYNLEPVPHLYRKLVKQRPNSRNIQIALSDRVGEANFTHAIHPDLGPDFGNGSISHSQAHLKDLLDRGCSLEKFNVRTMTWRDFITRETIQHVDLLVLDVEGHEMAVLDGMKGASVLPMVMCVEFGHLEFRALRATVEALGYQYDIHSNANAFFVRSDAVQLLALRHSASCASQQMRQTTDEAMKSAHLVEELRRQVEHLSVRETELLNLYRVVISSKAWRISEYLKRLLRR